MMFLKALTLKGFKSFAENTDLVFEPGVTVVVGPNGSGKSNLVDAVAWVLGAQGARALRGAKMDDVIFAGTTKKPALGRAEVSLTIDNSDNSLPIEFSEVTITRTLFRSGESEYRLNGVPCRLLDIQELLSDSRIGRTQHVIVGQGQLDSVLNARPEDRRAIIEEAAGVLKYRKRREKAQRRLESTEGNLTRLNDLIREVRRQLSPLQKQADAARRHDGVRDELNSIRLYLTGKEIYGLRASIDRVNNERTELKDNEKSILAELSDLDVTILDAEASLMQVGDSDVSAWLTRAERLVAKASATIAMLNERKRSLLTQLEASADESVIESLLLEKQECENNLIELENSKEVLTETLNAAKTEYEQFKVGYDGFVGSEPNTDIVREYESLINEQKLHDDSLSIKKERYQSDSARLDGIRNRITILTQDNNDAQDVLATEMSTLDVAQKEHDIATSNLDGLKQQIELLQNENNLTQAKAAKAQAHYEVLSEAYERQISQANIDHIKDHSGVLGSLLENISIDDVALDALSVVLDNISSSVVVQSPSDAKNIMNTLSSKELTAQLFILDTQSVSSHLDIPSGTTLISQYIKSDNELLLNNLSKMLERVVFVDANWSTACDIALEHPDFTVVSRSGDIFASKGSWSLGKKSARAVTGESVDVAKREVENTSRSRDDIATQLNVLIERQKVDERGERELLTSINEINSRLSIAKQSEQATRSAITARSNEADTLSSEILYLQQLIEVEETTLQETRLRAESLKEQKDNIDEYKQAFDLRLKQYDEDRVNKEQEIRKYEIDTERITTRLNDTASRKSAIELRLAKDPEQQQRALERRNALLNTVSQIENLIERTSSLQTSAQVACDVLSTERKRQSDKAHESSSRLEGLRKSRRESENNLVSIRSKVQQGEIEETEAKTKLVAVIEALRAQHDCEPQIAIDAPVPDVPEGTTLTSRARELDRDLKLMGPINPLAVQEFDELNERHVFLGQQLDDVKSSRKELHKVIKNIDVEIVTVFEKAFEDVQKHFSDLFSTLFQGGSGRLMLTDPSDMLNTGIDMEARPSGKNVRRLSLLSGGERSLTALAFLFAVFRSRPSPFYIMDEVEAALDEPNLMRFLDLVAEFRDDAQLLIVSHQKKTMEAADELYGVTMAPGGSSRAIKQRIEKPKAPVVLENLDSEVDVIDLVSLEQTEQQNQDKKDEFILESMI